MGDLRILQIAHDHPDWTPGGTEFVAHDLATALDCLPGTRARFLACATDLRRPDEPPGHLGMLGADFTLRTGAYDRFMMSRLDGADWIEAIRRVIGAARPDIVHLHGLDRIGAEILPVLRRFAPRARIILTIHDFQLICANDGLMTRPGDGMLCRGAAPDACARCFPEIAAARHALRRIRLLTLLDLVDAVIAPSHFLRDRLVQWGLAPARIVVLPNAVAAGAPALGEPAAPRARPNRFAFFGNIARHKGPLVLLDATARLRDTDLRVTLRGGLDWAEPAFRAEFDAGLAAARPVAQHLGAYDRAEVSRLMAQADWLVVPSIWWENAPLVILEARRAGRPVICSDIGGMREMVADGTDGLLFPAGDAAALAELMANVAGDPALWARLSAAAPPADHAAFLEGHLRLYTGLARKAAA